MTVYEPGISGVQVNPKVPLESVVVVPICLKLPLESITLMVTGTPVALVGIGFCIYTYSIHALWLASDIHGTPFGKSAACSFCLVPAEMSITVPEIVTGVAVVTPTLGAVTVVWLGPWPIAYIWLS